MHATRAQQKEKIFKLLAAIIVIGGIVIRLVVYLQNRNLIIDEANVARNIYERGFAGLLKPLSYEQYAPPVFLWLVKLSTILFGFSEYALKLYPFICGISSVYLLYLVLQKFVSRNCIWLSMALYALCPLIIRYATELKQYDNDVFIMLLLILLALRINIAHTKPGRFALIWFVAGSFAIWTSMPSVFILAGVGCYYGWNLITEKYHKGFIPLAAISLLWLIQFSIYYLLILKPQANSSYLQNFHHDYFLYLTPSSLGELIFNWTRIQGLIGTISGDTFVSIVFFVSMMAAAIMRFSRYDKALGLLLAVPVLSALLAAALKQFSLIPRVSLFAIVLFIIISGYGFDYLLMKSNRFVKPLILTAALYTIGASAVNMLRDPFRYEELTEGLQFAKDQGITGDYLYLYHSSGPAFIYYTQIHPGKDKWSTLKNGEILKYDTPYASLAWQMHYSWETKGPFAFVFTNETQDEFDSRVKGLHQHLTEIARLDKKEVKCVIMHED